MGATAIAVSLDEAWALAERALPSGWVLQMNIWRPEDWKPGERAARYTASAGPNEGPEEAWRVGAGDSPVEALLALIVGMTP